MTKTTKPVLGQQDAQEDSGCRMSGLSTHLRVQALYLQLLRCKTGQLLGFKLLLLLPLQI